MIELPNRWQFPAGDVDFSRPFFPEYLTALYFTPSWGKLSAEQQRRYTQHYALYLNEQTAFFEEQLAETILPALYERPDRLGEKLAGNLKRFQKEEQLHTEMFRRLSHQVDPLRFSLESQSYHFIRLPRGLLKVFNKLAGNPWMFPCWIWLALLQEERSISVSQACMNDTSLDERFRQTHLYHLRDEANHVQWDLQMIEAVWKPRSELSKRVNVAIFRWLMREFFTSPKRAALAVVEALCDEFPDLEGEKELMFEELRELRNNQDYHRSLYSREHTPRAFALFDELPEFNGLENTLLGYEPQ
ncbi:MAG: diiron oxygenase [Akkermansiaceae bacterium]